MSRRTLLLVAHTASVNLETLAQAARLAAERDIGSQAIDVCLRRPLDAMPNDVLRADALLFGTCENLGALAGLSKDFFDRCYYPVLEQKQGLPFAAYIRAGHDGTGATRQLQSITTGLRWRWVADPLVLKGSWNDGFVSQVEELAMGMALGLEQGIF